MNECNQACDAFHEELGRLKTVGTRVRGDGRCLFTNKYVIEEREPFYAFPLRYVVLETRFEAGGNAVFEQKAGGLSEFHQD